MSTSLQALRRVGGLLSAFLLILPAAPLRAQYATGFIPYYGKNKVHYDNFAWRVYKSSHFEIYYYPEFEQHLSRLTSYLESGYQHLASGLKHEMPAPIPAILYKTHSEFEQTNLYPTFLPEGVLAFAEPTRGRLLLPIDEPPDRLNGLIQHELTHVFAFDIIPRSFFQRGIPLWIDEGLADYFRGVWDPLDLMMIRDAAVTDQVPKLSRAEFEAFSGRLVYNMGHACFEFMEARYGKEGIRQFLYTLRKGILGGSVDDIYQQAFRITPEEFDNAFDKWLKDRFKPFRDKQRPDDYGRELSPNKEKTRFTQVFGLAASPSGEMVAALTANRADGEADIILLSTKDGSVIKNLTSGFTGQYESISFNDNFVAGRSIGFDPHGDTVAFFARADKRRTLFLVSVIDGKVLRKIPVRLDQAQAPAIMPNGQGVLFAGLREGVSDIYQLDLESGNVKNLTADDFYDTDPQISPDGTQVVYTRRVSGHDKVFTFALKNPARKTQLTFGPHDDVTPTFGSDGKKVYYSSTEDDDIYNVRSLDLETGVIEQYTDALGGTMCPAVLKGKYDHLAFITYFKGEYRLFGRDTNDPVKEVEQDVRSADEGSVDFQADVPHQVIPENKRKKGTFEGLQLEGRPPLNIGVSSGGDFFGGTQVALTDVLGDHNLMVTAYSYREFRSYQGDYLNLSRRLHWGVSAFDQTQFFFASPYNLNPTYSREGAFATQRITGGIAVAQWPLNKFQRIDISAGAYRLNESFENPDAQALLEQQAEALGQPFILNNGTLVPITVGFTHETTRFAEFGPLSGTTGQFTAEFAPSFGGNLSRQTLSGDARTYLRLGSTSTVFALRGHAYYSTGDNPGIFYFGGNQELRGYPYLSLTGNQGFFANAELRLPLIQLAATPIGIIGPVRGTAFFGIGAAHYKGDPTYNFSSSDPGTSYVKCLTGTEPECLFGEPVDGFHLVDGRASYGFGFQIFLLGYPLHFDWAKLTDLKVTSPWQFSFWIGYDF
jgi:Tol biopolymer transport system component